jgi:hypothetical protein
VGGGGELWGCEAPALLHPLEIDNFSIWSSDWALSDGPNKVDLSQLPHLRTKIYPVFETLCSLDTEQRKKSKNSVIPSVIQLIQSNVTVLRIN